MVLGFFPPPPPDRFPVDQPKYRMRVSPLFKPHYIFPHGPKCQRSGRKGKGKGHGTEKAANYDPWWYLRIPQSNALSNPGWIYYAIPKRAPLPGQSRSHMRMIKAPQKPTAVRSYNKSPPEAPKGTNPSVFSKPRVRQGDTKETSRNPPKKNPSAHGGLLTLPASPVAPQERPSHPRNTCPWEPLSPGLPPSLSFGETQKSGVQKGRNANRLILHQIQCPRTGCMRVFRPVAWPPPLCLFFLLLFLSSGVHGRGDHEAWGSFSSGPGLESRAHPSASGFFLFFFVFF